MSDYIVVDAPHYEFNKDEINAMLYTPNLFDVLGLGITVLSNVPLELSPNSPEKLIPILNEHTMVFSEDESKMEFHAFAFSLIGKTWIVHAMVSKANDVKACYDELQQQMREYCNKTNDLVHKMD
jgi:hypothetical protein